jgi:hypothetical protein
LNIDKKAVIHATKDNSGDKARFGHRGAIKRNGSLRSQIDERSAGLSSELAISRAKIDERNASQSGQLASLRSQIDQLKKSQPQSEPLDQSQTFPLSDWWKPSFWEPTVALAIRDYCRPGNVVFDVGTNAAGLALMMLRLVGPRGIVLAFEASPRIIDKTHYNLVKVGCHNVTLFHKAVWSRSGDLVNMAREII